MKIIKLHLLEHSYNIIIGNKIINLLGKFIRKLDIGQDAYIVTNTYLKNRYGRAISETLKESKITVKFKLIPDTEKSKSFKIANRIIEDILRYDKKRRIFILALGGGVIGDLAGFVASIYKRGIPYIQVPTTLLAQVDSAIGGKTAVDLISGKNLVGAFYQPRLVFSDADFLRTLSLRQIRSGLAEVIKYGIIKDRQLFNYLEENFKEIFKYRPSVLEFVVQRCSYIKVKIVQQDEKETRGIRTILNFGHTIGHAIETAGDFKIYNHGEAIALGMLVASDLSKKLSLITDRVSQRIENVIKAVGLPTRIERVSILKIIKAYYRDKKFIGSQNRLVLIEDIGKTRIVEDIPLKIIKEVLRKRFKITS